MLSGRGQKNLSGSNPLVAAHFHAEADPWHPKTNPEGYINMGTAENGLLYDLLKEKFRKLPVIPENMTHYTSLEGDHAFRSAFAEYFSRGLKNPVDAGQVVMSTGSSAILDQLSHLLFEAGDGILIPAPYYSGFDHNLTARAGLLPVSAYLSSADGFRLSVEVLKETIARVMEDGIHIRALLITNPHNPLGDVYPPGLIREIISFARKHNYVVIVDEIYRNSIFKKSDYTSALDLAGDYTDHVHVVYGFAKDFGLSGFKAGVLISRNKELLKAMPQLTYISCLSTATQHILHEMISDSEWITGFQAQNLKRIARAYGTFTKLLDERGIPYHPAKAGFFIWLDLRAHLYGSNREGEMKLFKKLFDQGMINLSPGAGFHALESGWFRSCFARDDAFLTEAADRLEKVLLV